MKYIKFAFTDEEYQLIKDFAKTKRKYEFGKGYTVDSAITELVEVGLMSLSETQFIDSDGNEIMWHGSDPLQYNPNIIRPSKSEINQLPENMTHISKQDASIYGDTFYHYWGAEENIILPDDITAIDDAAFKRCSRICSIVIPNTVTVIESETFAFCKNLAQIVLPSNIKRIKNSAFYRCASLKAMIIPDGCTYIGSKAFYGCDNLLDLYIPSTVTYIGKDAFFRRNPNIIIHAEKNSCAWEYARKNKQRIRLD